MLRKLLYLLVLAAWLLVMALPILAMLLAVRGELTIGNEQGSNVRLFLVITDDAKGIGVQRVRRLSAQEGCFQGSVRYLLWEGQNAENDVDYCTCTDQVSGFSTGSNDCQTE